MKTVCQEEDEALLFESHVERERWWANKGTTTSPSKGRSSPKEVRLFMWWIQEGVLQWELLTESQRVTCNNNCSLSDQLKALPKGKWVEFVSRRHRSSRIR